MFRKELMLTAIVLFFSACVAHAGVIIYDSNWVGGEFGYWEQASNWNPPKVPHNSATERFIVTIDSNSIGVNEAEVELQEDHPIDMLRCYGNVDLEGPAWVWRQLRLEEPNGLVNYGSLDINAYGVPLFGIKGNTTNVGGAVLDLWGANIDGALYNQTSAMIQVNGEVNLDGDVDNAGIIMVATDHELNVDQYVHNSGQIMLLGGGCGGDEILDNNSAGVIEGFGVIYGAQEVQNKGRINAYGGSLAVVSGGDIVNTGYLGNDPLSSLQIRHIGVITAMDVNNLGTIEVNAGGGVAFDSNLVNEPNATIILLGGTLSAPNITQLADATFEGQGNVTTDNLLIGTDGLIRLTGPTNIFGNVQIDPNATLEISDGQTLIKGHTTCNNGTIHMIGGRVICQGGLTNNNCNIIWEPGTYTNMADFNLDGTVNFKDFSYFGDTWLWQADWY